MALDWWRDNFWLILAVAIIFVSTSLGIILFCVCRRLLRQGKKWAVVKPLKQQQRDEEKMYEATSSAYEGSQARGRIGAAAASLHHSHSNDRNVTDQFSVQLPPLPPRGMLSSEKTSPQETSSLPPAAYSSVNKVQKKKTVAALSYMEPENDYDDVDVPASMENRHLETAISSFWQPEEGSHNLF